MQINYNISAMIANNALATNDNKLAESIERLSSGLKIANAKDNPSGLAISRRMNAQIKGLGVAGGNSGDGISVIQTADGTLTEVHSILQRMSELAIQAANGTNSESDLGIIQDEIAQLKEEITRISEATQFNGQTLLDGSFDLRGYALTDGDTDPKIGVNSYSDQVDGGNYYIEGIFAEYDEGTGKVKLLDEYGFSIESTSVNVIRVTTVQGQPHEEIYMADAAVTVDGDLVKVATRDGKEIEIRVNRNLYQKDNAGLPQYDADKKLTTERIDMELTGKGAMTMQIGANEGQTLDIRMPKITLTNLGLEYTDVSRTYKEDLLDAVEYIKASSYLTDDEKNLLLDRTYYDRFKGRINEEKGLETGLEYHFINVEDAREIIEARRKYGNLTADWDAAEAEEKQAVTDQAQADRNVLDSVYASDPSMKQPFLDAINNWENEQKTEITTRYNELRANPLSALNKKIDEIFKAADDRFALSPHSGADQAIEDIGNAIQKVSDIRSRLGAYQNRLEHTVSNINVTSENMTAAYSRIMDVDMAEEMTVYTTQQVLSQAGTSMLAQANERPSQVLQLLQ